MYVERGLTTVGKEENICSMVVFPYNEDDVKEQFQVEDVDELRFMDNPDSRLSVGRFNDIMREAVKFYGNFPEKKTGLVSRKLPVKSRETGHDN